jgi:hypothetical protein
VVLARAGEDWKVNGEAGDKVFVRQFLNDLSELKAERFPDETRDFGFGNPRLKVTVRFEAKAGETGAGLEHVLVVGDPAELDEAKNPKSYFAGVGALNEPFIINQDSFKKISPSLEILRQSSSSSAGSSASPAQ